MKPRSLVLSLAVALAAPIAATVTAADLSQPTIPPQVQTVGGYLGILLGPVPDVVRMQLGGVLPTGQGVMIRDIEENSPAAKAGLKVYDILLVYGDQRLFTPEQVSRLIRADSPNKRVTLQLVRGGVRSKVQVTLGQAQIPADFGHPTWGMPWVPPMARYHLRPYAPFYGPSSKEEADNWQSFDALSLKKRQDGSFQATIQYLTREGKLTKQEFTGSRDEIRNQIMQQRDLPSVERNQLLDTLSARDDVFSLEDRFPHRFFMPPFDWPSDF